MKSKIMDFYYWYLCALYKSRAETNIRIVWPFARLCRYLNTKRVFRCTVNEFSTAYFVINSNVFQYLNELYFYHKSRTFVVKWLIQTIQNYLLALPIQMSVTRITIKFYFKWCFALMATVINYVSICIWCLQISNVVTQFG